MEGADILFTIRNSFYLGNYQKVLDKFKANQMADITEQKPSIHSYIAQSLVKLGKSSDEDLLELNLKTEKFAALLKLYTETQSHNKINVQLYTILTHSPNQTSSKKTSKPSRNPESRKKTAQQRS